MIRGKLTITYVNSKDNKQNTKAFITQGETQWKQAVLYDSFMRTKMEEILGEGTVINQVEWCELEGDIAGVRPQFIVSGDNQIEYRTNKPRQTNPYKRMLESIGFAPKTTQEMKKWLEKNYSKTWREAGDNGKVHVVAKGKERIFNTYAEACYVLFLELKRR